MSQIKESFEILIIGVFVCFGWQVLEYLIEGEVLHRHVDDVIGCLLALSLWFNYNTVKKNYLNKKASK